MVKTYKSNNIDQALDFFQFWNRRKVKNKKQKEAFKSNSQNNLVSDYLSNDIILSCSGQVKIENLDSCLNLVRSDFIVF